MEFETIRIDGVGAVRHIVLNRPQIHNAISKQFGKDLLAACRELDGGSFTEARARPRDQYRSLVHRRLHVAPIARPATVVPDPQAARRAHVRHVVLHHAQMQAPASSARVALAAVDLEKCCELARDATKCAIHLHVQALMKRFPSDTMYQDAAWTLDLLQ